MRAKADMYRHQQAAATRFYESAAVQAVIPMGGGKTCSALTAISELIDDEHIRCALVLAPKRVAQLVWPKEPNEWEHLKHLRVVKVAGTEAERIALLNGPGDVYTIGLDHTPWLVKYLKALPLDHRLFDLLVVDELSKLKAPRGTWGKALTGISRRWRNKWMLTGTPRPNGYIDQFRPLSILAGDKVWGTLRFDKWRDKHFMKDDYAGHSWSIRPEHEARIIAKISSVTFTIDPADMPDLPELVPPIIHWIDLPPKARRVYDDMEKKLFARYGKEAVLAANAGVASGKLAQIANGFMYNEAGEVVGLHDEKSLKALDLVEALDGDPALLVYDFIEDLDFMRDQWPGLPYFGDDTNDADAERFEAEWNNRKLPLLGMHPASAAHGLNLQYGGNQIIWYGMTWSAELFDQLIKRIHRPGQMERCFNHLILARGTVDEIKFDRVVNKMTDQEAFNRYLKRI